MISWRSTLKKLSLAALLLIPILIATWLPRGLELDHFVTVDEPKWMDRSAVFYVALATGEFADTYQKEHPGVTVMWAETAGFLWLFPKYLTEGYGLNNRPQKFKRFLEKREYDNVPMIILEAGRAFIVLGNVIILALAFLAAVRLIGLIPSLVGFLLIAFDPFSIALSRLLHPDALLSALMLLALLSFMNFLYRGRHFYDLTIAAVAAGLAWLTKIPSFSLIPFFGLLSVLEIGRSWWTQRQLSWREAWHFTWPLLAWAGIAALVFVLLWPAMWVDPVDSLSRMYAQVTDYAIEGNRNVTFFNGRIFDSGDSAWYFYPISYLWRTTPPVLIGFVLAMIILILQRRLKTRSEWLRAIWVLTLFAAIFTLLGSLSGKKSDRYLLPVHGPLILVATLGWFILLQAIQERLANRISQTKLRIGTIFLLGVIIFFQLLGVLQTFPYYFTYYNPSMGGNKKAPEVMMIGWGEGLDQAARYLNAKPDANMLRVQTWYHNGPFSYFFEGDTIDEDFDANLENLQEADYYVVYFHQWQRLRPSEEFISYIDQQDPEHIVYINGLEYARIYRRE
jgi:hypothetical protein